MSMHAMPALGRNPSLKVGVLLNHSPGGDMGGLLAL